MKNINCSIFNKKIRPVRVLQFGEGNFLRCFVEWIISEMNDKTNFNGSVNVVQPLEFGRVKEIKDQDGLYTVILEGVENGQTISTKKTIDVINDLINPYMEYQKYLDQAKNPDLKFIISNTTEAGIKLEKDDLDYTKTPFSYPGKLLALLKNRYDYFNGSKESGLNIIPCELIDYNGEELKKVLKELSIYKKYDGRFIDWLLNDNFYYNTLVDRIVPGYPKKDVERFQNELGYIDNSMVKGEIFHLWVIEDHHNLKSIFPCIEAGLNVKFVDDFWPYKVRKVKILNGSHTCMVPISYLYGIDTVGETMSNQIMNKLVTDFIFDEVVPTINLPKDDMEKFAKSVLERYANPFIRHELMSIALNSITKYKTRILPTVIDNFKQGRFPKISLFSLSSLIVFYFGKRDKEIINLSDDKKFLELFDRFKQQYDGTKSSIDRIVTEFLNLEHWETDCLSKKEVIDFVSEYTYKILNDGMKKTLEVFISE